MRVVTSIVAILALTAANLTAQDRPLGVEAEAAAYRQLASGIPLGSRIKVQARGGRRQTATLVAIHDDAIVIQRVARIPEPPTRVPYTELTRLHLDERSGFTLGKALAIGLAAGAGAILTIFSIALAMD